MRRKTLAVHRPTGPMVPDIAAAAAEGFRDAETELGRPAMLFGMSATPLAPAPSRTEDEWLGELDPSEIRRPEVYLRDHVDPDELNDLERKIAAEGVILQRVRVRPAPDGQGYLLVDGQRRWMVAGRLGMKVPVIVDAKAAPDAALRALYHQYLLNSNREAEPILDRARFVARLLRDVNRRGEQVIGSLTIKQGGKDAIAEGDESSPLIQRVATRLGVSSANIYLLVAVGEAALALEAEGEVELVTRLTQRPEVTWARLRDAFHGNRTAAARKSALRQLDQALAAGDAEPGIRTERRLAKKASGAGKGGKPPIRIVISKKGRVTVKGGWTVAEVARDPERFRNLAITALDEMRRMVEEAARAGREAEGGKGTAKASKGRAAPKAPVSSEAPSLARQAMSDAASRRVADVLPPPPMASTEVKAHVPPLPPFAVPGPTSPTA